MYTLVLEKTLKIPWTARSNQPILREIYPEYSLEDLILKPKHQYFGHLMGIANSLEKSLMLGRIEGRRSRGYQRMRWLDSITDAMSAKVKVKSLSLTLCDPMGCSPPGSSVHGILQARILEWVAISFSRGSSRPRDRTQVSHIAGRRFNL